MKNPNDNMLLRIAQADAFASAVEYVKREEHPKLFAAVERFDSYQQHPTHLKLRPGMYTDDCQMSLAIADLLLLSSGTKTHRHSYPYFLQKENYYPHFFNAFKRDPRDGYSRGFQKILEESTSHEDMRRRIIPNSTKNGAAMRAVPLGVLFSPNMVITAAREQAAVTHNTQEGCESAIIVAMLSHFALYESLEFSECLGWMNQHLHGLEFLSTPWEGRVDRSKEGGYDVGMNTAWAVCTLLRQETSLMGIMRKVIEWGGDTDSVAAVAWGIASCRHQDEVLPKFLERDLEAQGNPKYGPRYLKRLGRRLMEAYDT
jgi:ADP-ribosylglycohydrolase